MNRLYLSQTDKKLLGVCGGIGETYGIDPSLVRMAMVLFCLITMVVPVLVTYVVAYLVIPEGPRPTDE